MKEHVLCHGGLVLVFHVGAVVRVRNVVVFIEKQGVELRTQYLTLEIYFIFDPIDLIWHKDPLWL